MTGMDWMKCICGMGCRMGIGCYCCTWCCEKCKSSSGCNGCKAHYMVRIKNRGKKYECELSRCKKQCEGKEKDCKCDCCVKKCTEQPDSCKNPVLPPLQPSSASASESSSSREHSLPSTGEQQPAVLPVTAARSGDLGSDGDGHSITVSPDPSTSPQAIAAVIVAIIVAIILLDLCIFRFPVGRNIRDFLVRKVPFCIAFYS
ncbi:hypothetical protein BBBOND_0305330 [Babesia bigemina]|uniref:Uncharacterized protein n=1 Tax=Babesia bigemina TaxID=5866 RepID=A0A061DDW3_BABBI|nr:hypothetical protein BBBOND_0305330 [Babesia bigemina]CDR96630.1 hypothetical protein BBBOND_0305330 [Babesia bigemina]|eukprot:XP_012768816.1 hypothetical protein BBBOND_0305330 [Babesia bigemina]